MVALRVYRDPAEQLAVEYDSEKEQLDAIKKWWKENGRVISVGLVVGLGSVFGWTWWQSHAIAQSEEASSTYAELVNWTSAENYGRADELAETLMRDFPNSGYAALGGLIRASSAFGQSRVDEARGYLQWVMERARRPELKRIARLRLARLALDQKDHEGALALLDQDDAGTLGATFEELRGDLQLAMNQAESAYQHYATALESERLSSTSRNRIQMKLDDLGLGSTLPVQSTE